MAESKQRWRCCHAFWKHYADSTMGSCITTPIVNTIVPGTKGFTIGEEAVVR